MTTRMLTVVSAGLRQPSSTRLLADRLTAATERALAEHDVRVETTAIELRDHAHELTDAMLTGFPGGPLREAIDATVTADGLIAVSPIFTASYSGLFKSFFDVLEADALTATPVLVAATGGTERHSLALDHAMRPLFAYLRSVVVPTGVYAASSDWGGADDAAGALGARIDRAARELADMMRGRPAAEAHGPFEEPTPFEELLSGRVGS
jgi:FMN reductase